MAADSSRRSIAFHSRFTSASVVYPSPVESCDGVVEALERAVVDHGIDLVIPVTDDVILPLSTVRPRFEKLCPLALPEASALETTVDKLATVRRARQAGVPVPRTELVRSASEAVVLADQVGWPVVVKPRFSRTLRDGRVLRNSVTYAHDHAALVRAVEALAPRSDVLVSAYVPGVEEGVELLMDDGRPLLAFQHRRLHGLPITGGTSASRESVPLDDRLYEHAVRFLGPLRWTGLAMVEYRVDGDRFHLIEVNGRVWGSLPLAVRAGVDFPTALVDVFCGAPSPQSTPATYPTGVRSRDLELELRWIVAVLRSSRKHLSLPVPTRSQALVAAARLLFPRDGYDVLVRDDPRPVLAELGRVVRALSGDLLVKAPR